MDIYTDIICASKLHLTVDVYKLGIYVSKFDNIFELKNVVIWQCAMKISTYLLKRESKCSFLLQIKYTLFHCLLLQIFSNSFSHMLVASLTLFK